MSVLLHQSVTKNLMRIPINFFVYFFKSCYLKREEAAWLDLFPIKNVEWSSVNTPFVMFWGTIYDCQWSFEEKKKQTKSILFSSGKINGKGGWGKSGGRGILGVWGKRSFTGFDLQQQWEGSDKRVDKEFFLRHWIIFISTREIQFDLTNFTQP